MAGEQQPSIEHLLNGKHGHQHPGHGHRGGSPSPGTGSPPSSGSSPPPPAPGGSPAPLAGRRGRGSPGGHGGSGSITYTDRALLRFAQTSDDRATSFNQAYTQAQHIQVSRDAFGYMFGAMVYGSYQQQAQSVGQGLQFAAEAMSSIASGIRLSVSRIDQDNQSIVQSLPTG